MELDPLAANVWTEDIVADGTALWKDPAILATYEYRSRLNLLDSCGYLMHHLARIGGPDYNPNSEDILRARLRTSGIVERMFEIHNVKFKFLDVGGQRNERRKWIHCFEGVTAVIFLTAINEYDQVLYEDEKVNRLHESLQVFESICNNKYFVATAMILFLNKIDLFNEKVAKVSIKVAFPDYEGPDTYEAALKYIEEKFLEQNKQPKLVFPHPTCATDTRNVEKVFDACRLVILKENLEKLGLT
jgi:GTPase SAR1 family protein